MTTFAANVLVTVNNPDSLAHGRTARVIRVDGDFVLCEVNRISPDGSPVVGRRATGWFVPDELELLSEGEVLRALEAELIDAVPAPDAEDLEHVLSVCWHHDGLSREEMVVGVGCYASVSALEGRGLIWYDRGASLYRVR